MTNDVKKDFRQKQVKKSHIQDLQFRLDMVANNTNNKKKQIGSTMPYIVVAEREARKQAKLKDRQFGSFRSSATGKSLTYLENGVYWPR